MNNNAIQDGQGNTSSLRVLMLSWVAAILILVTYLTLLNGKFPVIPGGIQAITTAIFVCKLWQNGQENKQENKPPEKSCE